MERQKVPKYVIWMLVQTFYGSLLSDAPIKVIIGPIKHNGKEM